MLTLHVVEAGLLYTVKNGVLFHWFKYNTQGCCSGFHGNLGCETRKCHHFSVSITNSHGSN